MMSPLPQTLIELSTAEEHFWTTSTRFYTIPEVKAELLSLQNLHQLNVNRLLLALWFSHWKKRRFESAEIDNILCHSKIVESWVSQIRVVRQAQSKPYSKHIKQLRLQLLECELGLEKEQQTQMLTGLLEGLRLQPLEHKTNNLSPENIELINLQAISISQEGNSEDIDSDIFSRLIRFWHRYCASFDEVDIDLFENDT